MKYRDILGYSKKQSKKKVVKEQSKSTVTDKLKKELNEWSYQPPSTKRWSKSFSGGELTEFEQKGGKDNLNEVDFSKVKLPAAVNRFLGKFVQSMKDANLNRIKRSAILYKVIDASGMSPQQLMADIGKIKRELK